LVIDDRKAGGILIESLNTELGSVAIIGIGINCRVDFQLAPLELREQGVSIHEVAREDQHESVWAESVLVRFLERWCDVRDRQPSTPDWLDREWPKRCWLTGKRVEVQNAAGRMQGTVVGLDPSGALLIQREGSGVTPVISGTVRVIGHPPRRSSSQDTPHPE
jgi:BirA family biotin operon repressor/biotin-[acetyl-CoA-carboxylase] ligase